MICFQKFVDNAQQCFAFTPQANFPVHNLNFHWRWRWWDQNLLKSFLLNLVSTTLHIRMYVRSAWRKWSISSRTACSSSSEIFSRHLVQIAMLVGLMAAFSHKYASLMKPLSQANAAPFSVLLASVIQTMEFLAKGQIKSERLFEIINFPKY
jgi:hypothetical protein